MLADPVFFRDLAYVLGAAVLGAVLARLARQPLILGYVVAGLVVSPLTPGPSVANIRTFELFAEIGIVLLMFSIGIEFSLRDLLRARWVAVVGGPLGMCLSILLGLGIGRWLGWPAVQGLVVGMTVSVASTMVLVRLLMDRAELHTRHGRIMLGITLVEDLAVVILIVLLPRLGTLNPERLVSIGAGLGLAVAILAPFLYLAAKVVPRLLTYAARMHSREVFLLAALAIAVGTAAATHAAGLSLALGAFLAGLMISESDHAHETLARLLPVRDIFVALFFVTMGALIDPRAVSEEPKLFGVILAHVMVGNFAIWTAVAVLFGNALPTAIRVGAGLTQIGEFSFILIHVARASGQVGNDVYQAVLAASLFTILGNAALVTWVPRWIKRISVGDVVDTASAPDGTPGSPGHVVLCGFGRVGSETAEALEAFGVPYIAIEVDPDVVRSVRQRGVRCLLGDGSNDHLLEQAGVDRAALVVVAIPEAEGAHQAVRRVRARNPEVPILARAHYLADRERLIEAGATEIIQPEVEAAATLIRHSLQRLALPRDRVLAYLERFRGAMEDAEPIEASGEALPEIADVVLGDAPSLTDQPLLDSRIRERFGVTVVALTRASGQVVLHPPAETILRRGDQVRVFGLPIQIEAFRLESRGGAA